MICLLLCVAFFFYFFGPEVTDKLLARSYSFGRCLIKAEKWKFEIHKNGKDKKYSNTYVQ